MLFTEIPSPPVTAWYVGNFPIRGYSLAIVLGIVAAVWVGSRRLVARTAGGRREDIVDIAFWAVPFGIVGARLYHVITTPSRFFGPGGDFWSAFNIIGGWDGLGIWGGIAGGALGAYICCRRKKLSFPVVADAIAPGLLLAQAIGRLGNYFNQELFGSPTTLPWGLRVDPAHMPAGYGPDTLFHPTFLYEMLWNLAMFGLLIYLDRKWRMGHGRVMLAYVALYTLGRAWIEMLRIDTSAIVLGLRLNVWVSLIMLIAAVLAYLYVGAKHPGRELDARRVIPDGDPASGKDQTSDIDQTKPSDPASDKDHTSGSPQKPDTTKPPGTSPGLDT